MTRRIVIKVGSALIAPEGKGCSGRFVLPIASMITQLRQQGNEVLVVSSGSAAAGRQHITFGGQSPSIVCKQAMAAIGQSQMIANWQRFFDLPCAQVLLTHGDLKDRVRYVNIKNTLRTLLANGALPIVNENDTVATEELKVGDNDNLAAHVAQVADADLLIILSDVSGVFEQDPRRFPEAKRIPIIEKVTDSIFALAGPTTNKIATGGMFTKLQAAEKASEHGIETLILNGSDPDSLQAWLAGNDVGTRILAQTSQIRSKKHWLKHTLNSQGDIVVDQGAVEALKNQGASLLAKGIVHCQGTFKAGDAITIICQQSKQPIAKGICQYGVQELVQIQGRRSQDIADILGYCPSTEVIHRDELVLL